MNFQSFCPYGLKSMMECISRATLLSQPTDIPDFLLQYLSELIDFRRSHPEADPKVVSFNYQELWENKFLRNMKGTTETPITTTEMSAASPQVPSQAEVEEALKMLYSDLASSAEQNEVTRLQSQKKRVGTNKTLGKDKKPSATPMYPAPTPPRVGRQFGKNVPLPFLVVKGEGKPAPPPRDVSMKTRRVSSVRVPSQQQSKGTTDNVKKTPETRQRILTPIPEKPSTASKSSAASKPSKLPSIPVPVVTQNLVLPPIPQKKTRGGQVSVVQGKGVSPKLRKGSPMNREVVPEKTSSRSPVRRALGPVKAKGKPKAASVPRPESTEEAREPGTESTSAGRTRPKVQEPEKKKIQPNRSPERTRGPRVLWAERARVKPIVERDVGGIQGTAFSRPASVAEGTNNLNLAPVSSPNHTCPHLAHAVHIIRYRRMQVRSSHLGHSGPSVSSHHHYGL